MENLVPFSLTKPLVKHENYSVIKFYKNNTKLHCSVCFKEFENIFCSTSEVFVTDNILCNICKETNKVIIRNRQINIYSKKNPPKTLELCCGDISPKFSNYYINVSEKDILNSIEKMIDYAIEDIKTVFASCLREILKYEPSTIHELYLKRSIEWKNWCDDIVIYFICRKKIFGKKIPIARFDEECKPNCNCMESN